MQIGRVVRVDKLQKEKIAANQLVSLYDEVPQEELTLDEFELFALDRLQLLRGIEILQARGFDGTEFNNKMTILEGKHMPLRGRGDGTALDKAGRTIDQRKDQISHFILRLAYCRSEDLRNWFCKYECALLKHRLDRMQEGERSQFMSANGLEYDQVSPEEKLMLKDKLMGLCNVTNDGAYGSATYYKIPFQQALQMMANRSVYLERGFAYVPLQRLVSIIVTRYRIHLSKALTEASTMFEHVSGDSRIGPLLKNMNKQYVGRDFTKSTQASDKLTPDKVDSAADNHMPLCMKNLHQNLKRDHKLKHWGRLQYGLFLKGAGLGAEDAQVFWENHFAKVMNHDQFQKQYAYSFRHMYGKEGSRKNYTPFSCMKIIMGAPPEPGAYHGCPYRHQPDHQLSALLGSLQLGADVVRDIVTIAKKGDYQVACQKHFDVTHPGHHQMDLKASDGVANHPNQWFQASVQYHKIKSGNTGTTNPSTTTTTTGATTGVSASASASASAGGASAMSASFNHQAQSSQPSSQAVPTSNANPPAPSPSTATGAAAAVAATTATESPASSASSVPPAPPVAMDVVASSEST